MGFLKYVHQCVSVMTNIYQINKREKFLSIPSPSPPLPSSASPSLPLFQVTTHHPTQTTRVFWRIYSIFIYIYYTYLISCNTGRYFPSIDGNGLRYRILLQFLGIDNPELYFFNPTQPCSGMTKVRGHLR